MGLSTRALQCTVSRFGSFTSSFLLRASVTRMTSDGDVSLKSLSYHQFEDGEDALLSLSDDSSFVGVNALLQSPSKFSEVVDEDTLDEFDAACTILSEMQFKGIITREERQRRSALLSKYLEFAATADLIDEDISQQHSYWGLPVVEATRSFFSCCRRCLGGVETDSPTEI